MQNPITPVRSVVSSLVASHERAASMSTNACPLPLASARKVAITQRAAPPLLYRSGTSAR